MTHVSRSSDIKAQEERQNSTIPIRVENKRHDSHHPISSSPSHPSSSISRFQPMFHSQQQQSFQPQHSNQQYVPGMQQKQQQQQQPVYHPITGGLMRTDDSQWNRSGTWSTHGPPGQQVQPVTTQTQDESLRLSGLSFSNLLNQSGDEPST